MTKRREIEDPWNLLRSLRREVKLMQQTAKVHSSLVHKLVGAQVIKGANQSIATGITTLVVCGFGTVDWDTDGFWVPNTLTVPVGSGLAGYYFAYTHVQWDIGTGDRRVRIRKNGTHFGEDVRPAAAAAISGAMYAFGTVNLAEGDAIDVAVSHSHSAALPVNGDGTTQLTYFGMYYLGV